MNIDQTEALTRVSRPTRYLGGELGSICKTHSGIDVHVALAFPDLYDVGMSHIGLPILYTILNRLDWVAAERVYAPWPDMEDWLRRQRQPLCSLESARPLGEFQILGITLQYELSYSNLLNMLELAGLPLRRSRRRSDDPLVVVGGPCAFNPEPLADFIDIALIGDGEEAVVELVELVRQAKHAQWSRETLLAELSRREGFYIPEFFNVRYQADQRIAAIEPLRPGYEKVRRRFVEDLETAPVPEQPIVPFMQTVHNRVALEIARGCTRGCRFCQAGYIYRPVRERRPGIVRRLLDRALENSGFEEVSLLSLSTGDYSCIEPLLKELMREHADDRVAVSLPSLRVGSLTPELMEEIGRVRKTGFTLAPEAGSERLRRVINKGISEADLLATTGAAFRLGWRLIKLYFMLGLPTESDADLEALIDLAGKVKQSGRGTGGHDVNVSVSTFVPKAHTPFQWEAQLDLEETRRRQRLLREGLQRKKLRFKYHAPEMSFLEGVFARGDRRLSVVLERARALGCRFDGWSDQFDFTLWQQAFADTGIDPDWYLRQRDTREILPWEHIDCGLPKGFFRAERERAYAGAATLDCRSGDCHGCGVCDFEQLKMRLVREDSSAAVEVSPRPSDVKEKDAEQLTRVRLCLSKQGRARMVGHLEYIKMFQRAARRARLPLRYSQGYHPLPKISYLEALPMGVASEAELIDLELTRAMEADEVIDRLNEQLPEGFRISQGRIVPWKTPSPSASVAASLYRVPVPDSAAGDLERRIRDFLESDRILVERRKKGHSREIDVRPDVLDLKLADSSLLITLKKGSPLQIAARLFDQDIEDVRRLGVLKTGVRFEGEATGL